jgi:hypothetical protein
MKSTFRILLICLPILGLNSSCSKDDSDLFVVNDFAVTMDENPSQDQLIGTIPYQINRGSTTFFITSQNVSNAISIINSSYQYQASVYVHDPVLFDFETNPLIEASVRVNRVQSHLDLSEDVLDTKTIIITINLNDLPD